MNIVQFGIKLKDMASGALLKFGETARKTSAAVAVSSSKTNAEIAETGRKSAETSRKVKKMAETTAVGFNEVTDAARKAGKQIDEVKQKAEKATKAADKIGSRRRGDAQGGKDGKDDKSGGAWDYVKGTALYNGMMAAGSAAAGFFVDAMQAGLDRQKIQTSFNVLAGSEETGQELTRQLVDLQQNTILGSEVFANAQTMMGFGFNALKDGEGDIKSVTENLKMLGDVSMGDKDHLNGLVLAYSQVMAAGKMNAGDLNQFINAGWNPLEQMSKQTGKSIGTLKEEIGEGKISFEMLHEALVGCTSEGGKFNNMLGTIAKTPFGKMQQLNGAWEEFKIKAGNALTPLVTFALEFGNKMMPYLEKMLDPLTQGVEKVIGYIKAVKPLLMQVFSPIAEYVSGIVEKVRAWWSSMSEKATVFMGYVDAFKDTIVNHVWPVIQKIVAFVGDLIGSVYEFVSQSEIIKDIFSAIQGFISDVWDYIGYIVDLLKWLFDNIVMPILNGIEKAYRFIKGVPNKSVVTSAGMIAAPVAVASPSNTPAKPLDEKTKEAQNTEVLNKIAENTKANSASSEKASQSVASSGPKVVNISLGKFFDNIVFNTTNLEQSVSKIENVVTECLSRILLDGAKAV